jgi:ribosomal protein S21
MADFNRKPGESFESFLRKFKKGLKNSKRLEKARSKQHLVPKKTKRQQKNYALISMEMRHKKEILRKTGKLEETQNR